MTCELWKGKDGAVFIACSRGQRRKRCKFCNDPNASKLCDYPLRGSKAGKTCDAPMCARCAAPQNAKHLDGDSVDFCPPHARARAPEQLEL